MLGLFHKLARENSETTWSQVEYDISNISIIVFIQNKYTKEILQVSRKNQHRECSMSTIFKKNDLCEDIGEIVYKYSKKPKYIRIVIVILHRYQLLYR